MEAAATVKGAMPSPRVWLIHALDREHRNNDLDRVATHPFFTRERTPRRGHMEGMLRAARNLRVWDSLVASSSRRAKPRSGRRGRLGLKRMWKLRPIWLEPPRPPVHLDQARRPNTQHPRTHATPDACPEGPVHGPSDRPTYCTQNENCRYGKIFDSILYLRPASCAF